MPTHCAFLRAVNVGGRNKVSMADLKDLFGALKFANVRTLLQSGNVVFDNDGRSDAEVERLLETETEKRLKVTADYFVRTEAELKRIIARNPFPKEAEDDPSHLVVIFMKETPESKNVKALQAAIRGPEVIKSVGKQVYVVYSAGIGESKLTNALIEKMLGSRGTGRNWNTVLKVAALMQG
jgi:uncharacterized protein (DUF1697 family)